MFIPETEKAWAAGFFDGEGTCRIQRSLKTLSSGREVARHRLHVSVSQKDRTSLDWLRARWGGGICGAGSGHALSLKTQNARRFLTDIFPYLQGRSLQAILAIEFAGLIHPRGRSKLDNDERAIREAYREVISELNIRSDRGVNREGR